MPKPRRFSSVPPGVPWGVWRTIAGLPFAIVVGVPQQPIQLNAFPLVFGGRERKRTQLP